MLLYCHVFLFINVSSLEDAMYNSVFGTLHIKNICALEARIWHTSFSWNYISFDYGENLKQFDDFNFLSW